MPTHKSPEVSVKLVLRVGDSVLMLRRPDGSFIFPGGHVEWGETTREALEREAMEELGYSLPSSPEFLNLYEYIAPDSSQHILILHYLLALDSRPVFGLGDDEANSTMLWLAESELTKIIPRAAFTRTIFQGAD